MTAFWRFSGMTTVIKPNRITQPYGIVAFHPSLTTLFVMVCDAVPNLVTAELY